MQIFFSKNDKNSDALFRDIELACDGLIYISESDAPIVAFASKPGDKFTAEEAVRQLGLPLETPVEQRDFDEFFSRLTANRDWHGDAERMRAGKFLALQKLLKENLRDLNVFRIGRIRIDIFVVGSDANGRVMGIATKAVET
jgi:hypothetical protein